MLVLALARESLLDLVFSSDSNLIQNVSFGPGVSDHELVSFTCSVNQKVNKAETRKTLHFTDSNLKLFKEKVACIDWNVVIADKDVTSAWSAWKEKLFDII